MANSDEVDANAKTEIGATTDEPLLTEETFLEKDDRRSLNETRTDASDADSANQLPANRIGEYRLIKKLGQGGMGEVFLAEQEILGRQVAIKTLKSELAKDSQFVERFHREARLMARLDHPNIVRCLTVGADPKTGIQYVAIDFVDGKNLQDWMNIRGQIGVEDAVTIGVSIAESLRYAHAAGLIHRDIKPDNILISKHGTVKLADLGLAKALDERTSMTQSGLGMGTPLYMPPEQTRNAKHVDHTADIYALGATLYHIIAGVPPFPGNTTIELLQAKEKGFFKPIRKANPKLPERLDLILDKMMAARSEHRHSSWVEVIDDLKSLGLAGESLQFLTGPTRSTPPFKKKPPAPQSTVRDSRNKARANETAVHPTDTTTCVEADDPQWQVCFKNEHGKVVFRIMTVTELRAAVSNGGVPMNADVKASDTRGFQPLSQCPEFQSLTVQMTAIQHTRTAIEQEAKQTRQRIDDETIGAIYEQTWFLVCLLIAIVSGIAWSLWPLNDDQLMSRAEALFVSGEIADKREARDTFLLPLLESFPTSPHANQAKLMVEEVESDIFGRQLKYKIRLGKDLTSESERLVKRAWDYEKLGDRITARENYEAVINIHDAADIETGPALSFARRRVANLNSDRQQPDDRLRLILQVLHKADELHASGRSLESQTLWKNILDLYPNNLELQSLTLLAQQRLDGNFDSAIPNGISGKSKATDSQE